MLDLPGQAHKKYLLPDEVEQDERTNSKVSAHPVNLTIWILWFIRWDCNHRDTVDDETKQTSGGELVSKVCLEIVV